MLADYLGNQLQVDGASAHVFNMLSCTLLNIRLGIEAEQTKNINFLPEGETNLSFQGTSFEGQLQLEIILSDLTFTKRVTLPAKVHTDQNDPG